MATIAFQLPHPSQAICLIRVTFVLCVAYTLSTSFMFVKSHKIIQAALSKVPITETEARKTKSIQIFTIIILVIISTILMVISYNSKPMFASYQDFSKMERIHFCDTSIHVSSVTGLILLIKIACFVQAFR